jgi:ribonuclease HII
MREICIGIDEVGRGPLAGPVCVAAFMLKGKLNTTLKLKDSKKLSQKQRELWFKKISLLKKEGKCDFALTYVSAQAIDKIGISKAIKKALETSLQKLVDTHALHVRTRILLDGGLKAPISFSNQKTIIKGDEKEQSIALASIVAKVSRDRLMVRLAKKHASYGFEFHKGYGTSLHYQQLKIHGMSPIHRRTFLKNVNVTSPMV